MRRWGINPRFLGGVHSPAALRLPLIFVAPTRTTAMLQINHNFDERVRRNPSRSAFDHCRLAALLQRGDAARPRSASFCRSSNKYGCWLSIVTARMESEACAVMWHKVATTSGWVTPRPVAAWRAWEAADLESGDNCLTSPLAPGRRSGTETDGFPADQPFPSPSRTRRPEPRPGRRIRSRSPRVTAPARGRISAARSAQP
jgi:hypothetical protein